jgi:hypothetical protein
VVAYTDEDGNGYFAGRLRVDGGLDAVINLTTLTVAGDGTIGGDLSVGDDLVVTDDVTVGGDVAITGSLTVAGQPITPGGGGGGGSALTPVSGRYSVLPGWGRASGPNLTLGAGDAVAVLFEVAHAGTIDRIGVDVASAAAAGGLLRASLYAVTSTTDNRPAALQTDFATIPSDVGTGAQLWTVSQAVTTGQVYAMMIAAQVAGCSLRTVETYDPRVTLAGTTGWTGTVASGAYARAGVTGAAPNPFGVPVDEVPVRIALRWA